MWKKSFQILPSRFSTTLISQFSLMIFSLSLSRSRVCLLVQSYFWANCVWFYIFTIRNTYACILICEWEREREISTFIWGRSSSSFRFQCVQLEYIFVECFSIWYNNFFLIREYEREREWGGGKGEAKKKWKNMESHGKDFVNFPR